MKKIYSTLGPVITFLIILNFIPFILFLLAMPIPYHRVPCNTSPFSNIQTSPLGNAQVEYAKLISNSILTVITLSALTSIGFLIYGAFNYFYIFIYRKKKIYNNFIKKTILRGCIGLGITILIYTLISIISNLNGCDLNSIGQPRF